MQAYACDMHMHVICAYAFDNTDFDCLILIISTALLFVQKISNTKVCVVFVKIIKKLKLNLYQYIALIMKNLQKISFYFINNFNKRHAYLLCLTNNLYNTKVIKICVFILFKCRLRIDFRDILAS